MGEIHELFVLPLSLVWFAGATPDVVVYFLSSLRAQTAKTKKSAQEVGFLIPDPDNPYPLN